MLLAAARSAQDRALGVTLTRIILVQPLFLGLGGFSIGVMNAHRRYRTISIVPII